MNIASLGILSTKVLFHKYLIRYCLAFFLNIGGILASTENNENISSKYLKLEIKTITYDNFKLKIDMRLQNISNEKIVLKHIYLPLYANCVEEDLQDRQTILGHPVGNALMWKDIELNSKEFIDFDMINFGKIKKGDHIIRVTFFINTLYIEAKNLAYTDVRIYSNHYDVYIKHDINTEKYLDKTY